MRWKAAWSCKEEDSWGPVKLILGITRDGRKASLYTIINKNGMEAVVSDFGAILVKLIVPNKDGEKADVVLGFDHLEQYEENPNFFGSTVGRSAKRLRSCFSD